MGRRRIASRVIGIGGRRRLVAEALESRTLLSTFFVESTADRGDLTLRQAILDANDNPGPDDIVFQLNGAGPFTIAPQSALPDITGPLTIDGYTQSGASPNTLAAGDNAVLMIVIDGSGAGQSSGLFLTEGASDSTIRGLVINNFAEDGITVNGLNGVTIAGNFIGIDPSGTIAQGNSTAPPLRTPRAGINLLATIDSVIGGTDPADRNLISGNHAAGIGILGSNAVNNVVIGNYVGTDRSGQAAVANDIGVQMDLFTTNNTVGGTDPLQANVISGNTQTGVLIRDAPSNQVLGNFLGTGPDGTAAVANGIGLTVSGSSATENFVSGNLISGNTGDGVLLNGESAGTTLTNNRIGTNNAGDGPLGNGGDGVALLSEADNNSTGFPNGVGGNVIAFNAGNGVTINSVGANAVLSNAIFANAGIGIDEGGDGPNPTNPLTINAVNVSNQVTINAIFNDPFAANQTFLIQFFANPYPPLNVPGQGRALLGETSVTTGGNGTVRFTARFDNPPAGFAFITGTATGETLSTTEFAQAPRPLPVAVDDAYTGVENQTLTIAAPGVMANDENLTGANVVSVVVADPSHGVVALNGDGSFSYTPDPGFNGLDTFTYHLTDGEFVSNTATVRITVATRPDLVVTAQGSPDPVPVAATLTYQVTVHNAGRAGAEGIVSTSTLPADVTFLSANADHGASVSFDPLTRTVDVFLGNLASRDTLNVTILVQPTTEALLTFTTTARTGGDSNPDNNTATIQTRSIFTFTVLNTNDSGFGSLRQAILNANAHPGAETIDFRIPGAGPFLIRPLSPLPFLTGQTTIDATTQPGFAGQPIVELRGDLSRGCGCDVQTDAAGNPPPIDGLVLSGGSNTVRGLNITLWPDRGIVIVDGAGNVIAGNNIGTDSPGQSGLGNNGAGVFVATAGNLIGGPSDRDRNVISGNLGSGVYLAGAGTTLNLIQNNRIGTGPGGESPLPNRGDGVTIAEASGNTIANNLIAGNRNNGVWIAGQSDSALGTNNRLWGNEIGTDATGSRAIPNLGYGVLIATADFNQVGGTSAGQGNLISGNGFSGIEVVNSEVVGIFGNRIGTDASGSRALGNSQGGIILEGTTQSAVGAPGAGEGNLISGNALFGLLMNGSSHNRVAGNRIGTDAAGLSPLGNGQVGVWLNAGSSSNTIGGPFPGARNLIAANPQSQLRIEGPESASNIVQGNIIGANDRADAVLSGSETGVLIVDAHDNQIGGAGTGEGNQISGNAAGIRILGSNASNNQIQGNRIGTNADGTARVPNFYGILIQGGRLNRIGGTAPGSGNLISGNAVIGVWLFSIDTAFNIVEGNLVGLASDGVSALPNGTDGIYVQNSPANTIGGTSAGARNVISGNAEVGLQIDGPTAAFNVVQGNFLGTDATGSVAVPNGLDGLFINGAPRNTIGGTTAGAGNVLSGNGSVGLQLFQAGATGNIVQGNLIGFTAVGLQPLGNRFGLFLNAAPDNVVPLNGSGANLIGNNRDANVITVAPGQAGRPPMPAVGPGSARTFLKRPVSARRGHLSRG